MRAYFSEWTGSTRAIFPNVVRRAGMLVVGFVLLFCGSAQAGTYQVWSCADAAGNPAPTEGWVARVAELAGIEHANNCAAKNGLYVSVNGSTVTDGASGAWLFKAPSDTTFESIRLWRSVITNPASVNRTYERIWLEPVPAGSGLSESCESPLRVRRPRRGQRAVR